MKKCFSTILGPGMILFAALAVLAGCPTSQSSSSAVYTAGFYGGATPVACYWTNGVKTDLPGTAARLPIPSSFPAARSMPRATTTLRRP